MADWSASMQQTYEYYVVDPDTWKDMRLIDTVRSCSINRDESNGTLGSASFRITESLGECYIRVYLITIQNGVKEKHPLGTFLVQTPSMSFDGKVRENAMDAYTPLLELKENPPPFGYSILKDENIMDVACMLVREHTRAPVIATSSDATLYFDFVSDPNDTWLTFLTDLIANDKKQFDLDEMGRIMFAPKQDMASLQPVWTYTDDNSSILYPDLTMDRDLYGVPNVVEVIYSNGNNYYYGYAQNDDPNSPTSIVNRGRKITHRVTDPDLVGNPTEDQIQEYAERTLRDLSSLEYTITYTHGYCPVRVGDCVRFNYTRAGLTNVKARVTSQSISCTPGCPVTETAVFTTKLWE